MKSLRTMYTICGKLYFVPEHPTVELTELLWLKGESRYVEKYITTYLGFDYKLALALNTLQPFHRIPYNSSTWEKTRTYR